MRLSQSVSRSWSGLRVSYIFLFSRAVGICVVSEPTCLSTEWPGCSYRPPRRSDPGRPRCFPAAGTSSPFWFWDTCRRCLWPWSTAAGPHAGFGSRSACTPTRCSPWTSTILPPYRPLGCEPEPLKHQTNSFIHRVLDMESADLFYSHYLTNITVIKFIIYIPRMNEWLITVRINSE